MAVRGQLHAQAALPRETIQMPTEKGAGWAVEPVWTFRWRKNFDAAGIRTADRPARSVDTVVTSLASHPLTTRCDCRNIRCTALQPAVKLTSSDRYIPSTYARTYYLRLQPDATRWRHVANLGARDICYVPVLCSSWSVCPILSVPCPRPALIRPDFDCGIRTHGAGSKIFLNLDDI
jgi:hypothetical protein